MKLFLGIACFISSFTVFGQLEELIQSHDKSKELLEAKKTPIKRDLNIYVNPFIGTGGHGHTFPGPVLPFGMMQLGPDTRAEGWDGCSGYHYSDSVIYGFSHTHLSGTGIPDYSDLLISPQVGKYELTPKYKDPKGYGATFKHSDEIAIPGGYSVTLKNPNVKVRLTTTERCGMHEYTFLDEKGKKFLVLDLGYRDRLLDVGAKELDKHTIAGFRSSEAWATNQHFYFQLETNIDFTKATWHEDKAKNRYVVVLEFPATTKKVLVRVGISGMDNQGAANNLASEIKNWDFDLLLTHAQRTWRSELSKVDFQSTDNDVMTNFYTALYHTYIHPSLWTDVDGRYRDFNNQIKHSDKGDLYSVFSLWDTYRGANPLYTLIQPKRVTQFVESFRQQYVDTKLLPVWTLSNNETNCMIGYHVASVIADAAVKGIQLYEPTNLLEAMIATSNHDHLGKTMYREQGFISASAEPESVSKTLEYSFDDWCISKFAKNQGNDSIANIYAKRSSNWMNLYHPESGFFQPRKGGMWLPNFKPNEVNHHFTEANGWQYSLAAPHHIASLRSMKGGNKGLEKMLDSLFYSSSEMSGREQADITGLIGQYAHGNEPSHHLAYLYNYCAAPYKTQALVGQILKEQYHPTPDGLSGNEDCGQMSAWYVLSAMGFYPVAPGSPTYAIGRPIADRVSLNLGAKPFVVKTINNLPENQYIASIKWNNEPYTALFITHEMLLKGGELEITMGNSPQLAQSTFATDLLDEIPANAISVPYFIAKSVAFSEPMTVSIDKLPSETGMIVYTTNGADPTASSAIADKNIQLNQSTTVKARIVRKEGKTIQLGPIVSTDFNFYKQDKTIALKTKYENQYAGSGEQCLIDGLFGGIDYRGTEWQGFQGKDVDADITLNEEKLISKVTISCLQDTKSWIFHPKGILVEVSTDGKNYKAIGRQSNTKVSDKLTGTQLDKFTIDFPPVSAKYVRVKVENYGKCPEWHLGAGGSTWLFLDEILVD